MWVQEASNEAPDSPLCSNLPNDLGKDIHLNFCMTTIDCKEHLLQYTGHEIFVEKEVKENQCKLPF